MYLSLSNKVDSGCKFSNILARHVIMRSKLLQLEDMKISSRFCLKKVREFDVILTVQESDIRDQNAKHGTADEAVYKLCGSPTPALNHFS